MSTERNKDTTEALSEELKVLKGRCKEVIQTIGNLPLEHSLPAENVAQRSLSYIEGLKNMLPNAHTPIPTDENLLTAQFLNEMVERMKQLEETSAFIKGAICDVDKELESLESQLQTTEQAKNFQISQQLEVTSQHIDRAKQHFLMLKDHLYGLIQSMFGSQAENLKILLAQLLKAHNNQDPNSNKYIKVSETDYPMVETLLGLNLVTLHPYDKTLVKLAY